jgi:hypothetical protein
MIEQLRLRRIGMKVRKACELFAHSEDASTYDFFVYTYGEYDNSLRGMCAIASCVLKKELIKKGFNAEVYLGEFDNNYWQSNHCWVVVDNKWIVDVTATQFGRRMPKVLIRATTDKRYIDGVPMPHMGRFRSWTEGQRPSVEIVTKIQRILSGKYKPEKADPKNFDAFAVDIEL